MKISLLILITTNLLLSDKLLDFYRTHGMGGIEKRAETLLRSEKYWLERLQYIDTDFGYYEDLEYLIVVNKTFPSLDLYKQEKNQFYLLQTNDVIVGENRGFKSKEGDKKTPTGVYELVDRLHKLDQFYGPLALVLSYPNLYDSLKGRTGSGIWIHGMPLNGTRERFTKGCVALENDRLTKFGTILDNIKKSIIILEDGKLAKTKKGDLALILSSLYQWLDAWRDGNFKSYINFYSKKFRRFDGNNFSWFKQYKEKIFSRKEKKEIRFFNINISPYPNSYREKLFRVVFDEVYKTSRFNFKGKKELYVKVESGKMEIVIEK
jgi:murein L,D-transpeptidase YafK